LDEKHDPPGDIGNTKPLKNTVLDDISDLSIPILFNFTDEIVYLKWWVENSSGDNVLYGNEFYEVKGNIGFVYREKFQVYQDGELSIKMLIEDKAGNLNMITYDFDLVMPEINIDPNEYFLVSLVGDKTETYKPFCFVHFKGDYIMEFRLRYDGLNGSNGENWTIWYQYPLDGYYDQLNPQSGFKIYFEEGDFANKVVEIQLRNSHGTKDPFSIGEIEYKEREGIEIPAAAIWAPIAGFGIVGVIFFMRRKYQSNREWKKYMK